MAKRRKIKTQLERDVEDLGYLFEAAWKLMDLGVGLGTASRVVWEGCQKVFARFSEKDAESPYLQAVAAGVFPDDKVRAERVLEVIRVGLRKGRKRCEKGTERDGMERGHVESSL